MAEVQLKVNVIHGDNAAVICAPHGHDFFTADIVQAICGITGLAGLTIHHLDDSDHENLRVNVNRPTEGAGLPPEEEIPTIRAARAYTRYLENVMNAGRGSLNLYVEVHGNETQQHTEVAVCGIPGELQLAVKMALEDMPGGALIEGVDGHITKNAMANKQQGIIRAARRALHFELPTEARVDPEARALSAVAISRAIMTVLTMKSRSTLSRLFLP